MSSIIKYEKRSQYYVLLYQYQSEQNTKAFANHCSVNILTYEMKHIYNFLSQMFCWVRGWISGFNPTLFTLKGQYILIYKVK